MFNTVRMRLEDGRSQRQRRFARFNYARLPGFLVSVSRADSRYASAMLCHDRLCQRFGTLCQ